MNAMTVQDAKHPADTTYDLIVVGAGCAGLSTALFAAIEGMKVLVLERTAWVGGTSALSAGALWIPGTHLAAGTGDTADKAGRYLETATGGDGPAGVRQRFLELGAQAVRCLEDHSDVQLRAFSHHPDYLSQLPDSVTRGRALECLPFDGRQLGADFARVRPPIPEFTVLGGMMVDRIDIQHLLNLTRSRASFLHALKLLARHAMDRLRHPRGTRLVLGNALVGRLLLSLKKRGVPVWTQAQAGSLVVNGGRVEGVSVTCQGVTTQLHARHGVVMAGGGFNDHPAHRARLIPACVTHSPRAGSSPGALLDQVIGMGARLSEPRQSAAFWAPVSVRARADGRVAVFPHFVLDRAKPGTVVVDATGRRFLNESVSYHQFGEQMLAPGPDGRPRAFAYLVADHQALMKYGLGMVRPGGRGLQAFLRDGYLVQAPTIEALAHRLDMPPEALRATVDRMNEMAARGADEDFQRGTTAYQRNLGDAGVTPNPNLGPIARPPYFAVRLQPADIAACVGLVTDAHARVMRGDQPLPGLYAVGNDMQSIMGDAYPGPGINMGPALVLAYGAVQAIAAARRETGTDPSPPSPAPFHQPGDKP